MNLRLKTVFLVLTSLALSACIRNHPYPKNWERLPKKTPKTCSLQSGLYDNRQVEPVYTNKDRHYFPQLDRRLLGSFHYSDYVRLRYSNDELVIELLKGSQVKRTRVIPVTCKKGWLTYEIKYRSHHGGMVWQINKISLMSHNGYLVLKDSASSFGIALIMPFAGKGRSWYRFRLVADSGA